MNFLKAFGIGGPTPEQQNRLILQMNTLNDYVKQHNIPFVPDDPNHPFVKCTNFAIEKKNGDKQTEYFLNLKDGFVSLSTGNNLGFMMGCISKILKTYNDDSLNNFMNGYLFRRPGVLTANVKTLYDVCAEDAATAAAAKEQQKQQKQENEQVLKRRMGESPEQYAWRMQRWRVEQEREQAKLALENPQNCLQNFANYLNSPTRLIGLNEIESMTPIYDLLVNNLGSTQDGFALGDNFRMQNILSNYTSQQIDEMRMIALQPQQKQKFIEVFCQNGLAIEIMVLANTPTDTEYHSYSNDSQQQTYDAYKANGWSALRRCLGLLELTLIKMLKGAPMQGPVQGQEQQMPVQGPVQVQGGKSRSKSKSKSNRKKRNSHRRHSHKHHKHRTPKRR